MIIVDASAAVLALLNDAEARRMLVHEAIACPHLVDSEIVHTLRRLVLRGDLGEAAAERAIQTWTGLGVHRVSASGVLGRIWELRANLSAYDATYVAVAEAIDSPLVTADRRLASAPGPRCLITVVPR